jgi:hypothetical protein
MSSTIQQIGFSKDVSNAILWQYDKSENLKQVLDIIEVNFKEEYQDFWEDWIDDVFNLKTANAFGISVWQIILNLNLGSDPTDTSGQSVFGFGQFNKNFNNGNFALNTGDSLNLTLEEKRLALLLRFLTLSYSPNIPNINFILKEIFSTGFGDAWVLDPQDMTIKYVFDFPLTTGIITILTRLDVFPRPAGVRLLFISTNYANFGFGSLNKNFDNGNFIQAGSQ